MEIKISKYRNLLVYRNGYSVKFIEETIKQKKLNGLRIFAELRSEKLDDLSFLKEMKFLKALSITTHGNYDLSFLSNLKNLQYLDLDIYGSIKFDLTELNNLKYFTIEYQKDIPGLENCNKLKRLTIIEYPAKDLKQLPKIDSLQEFTIISSSKIKSLNGINNFKNLKKVSVGGCRQLTDLDEISKLSKLIELKIDGCKKIKDYSKLSELPKLDNLTLIDSGTIDYLDMFSSLLSQKKLTLRATKIKGIEIREDEKLIALRKANLKKLEEAYKKK